MNLTQDQRSTFELSTKDIWFLHSFVLSIVHHIFHKVLRHDGGGAVVDNLLSIVDVAASEAIPFLVLVEAKHSKAKQFQAKQNQAIQSKAK